MGPGRHHRGFETAFTFICSFTIIPVTEIASSADFPNDGSLLAAVDLGSNSFHMVVARYLHGQLVIVDRLRESVRLAAGVREGGRIEKEAAARALACLERFGQRLRHMRPGRVRAVGTSALRQTGRKNPFFAKAREALGHTIHVISGREEARLIYSGVAHTMASEPGRRLVVDIGGGSTEVIVGEGLSPVELESLRIGCVELSERFFPDGVISPKRLARARVAARSELEPIQNAFRQLGWSNAAGSSGSIRAIGDLARELDPRSTVITADALELMFERVSAARHVNTMNFSTLPDDRRALLPAGVAILIEIFDVLGIESMQVAEGAMREGLLYDMVGRFTDEDARERTVRAVQQRYHVDLGQSGRVERTVMDFLEQTQAAWKLDDPAAALALRWAARLHEIGLDVSHSGYHRHGAYLLEHADMPGFTRDEQQLLALLVGGHRRKLVLERASELVPPWDKAALPLIVLLRLAVLLHRGRSRQALPNIQLSAAGQTLKVQFPSRWLREHQLTMADLQQEVAALADQGFRLRIFSGRSAA